MRVDLESPMVAILEREQRCAVVGTVLGSSYSSSMIPVLLCEGDVVEGAFRGAVKTEAKCHGSRRIHGWFRKRSGAHCVRAQAYLKSPRLRTCFRANYLSRT
jgi:hypothetical protein